MARVYLELKVYLPNGEGLRLSSSLFDAVGVGCALVLEDFTGPGSRRTPRVQKLLLALRRLALARGLLVVRYPRASVRRAFAPLGARTKEEIAAVIAARFPELAPRVPPKRKVWMSEDQRMAIFDAAGLVAAYSLLR